MRGMLVGRMLLSTGLLVLLAILAMAAVWIGIARSDGMLRFLGCDAYPTPARAMEILDERRATVDRMRTVGPPGSLIVELGPECGDRVKLNVLYVSTAQRDEVVDVLGGYSLGDLPVELYNY